MAHAQTDPVPAPRSLPWRALAWGVAALLLLLPLLAMRFTDEVAWTASDFAFAALYAGAAALLWRAARGR